MYNCSILTEGKINLSIENPLSDTMPRNTIIEILMNKKTVIITWIAEISLIIFVSFIYYLNLGLSTPNVLYVPQGSINKIIAHLNSKNIDVSALDSYILRFIGMPQQGWIHLGAPRMRHGDFLYKLVTEKAAMRSVTLIPGETTYVFVLHVGEVMGLDPSILYYHYKKATLSYEGRLVPDTYHMPMGIDEKNAIRLLLNMSMLKTREWSNKIFGDYNEKKWLQYVTVASIIQKEAASIEDMPMVSSVIYNRLKKKMKLQMDGTLNYGKYSHSRITARRIREDKSRYNTYLYAGLPDMPVCNVGFDAIKAAIFPAQTDYLYFVRTKEGKHRYSSYYSTHIKNINKLKNFKK